MLAWVRVWEWAGQGEHSPGLRTWSMNVSTGHAEKQQQYTVFTNFDRFKAGVGSDNMMEQAGRERWGGGVGEGGGEKNPLYIV